MNATTLVGHFLTIHLERMILLDFCFCPVYGGELFMAIWNVTMSLCHLYRLHMNPSSALFKCSALWLQIRLLFIAPCGCNVPLCSHISACVVCQLSQYQHLLLRSNGKMCHYQYCLQNCTSTQGVHLKWTSKEDQNPTVVFIVLQMIRLSINKTNFCTFPCMTQGF